MQMRCGADRATHGPILSVLIHTVKQKRTWRAHVELVAPLEERALVADRV